MEAEIIIIGKNGERKVLLPKYYLLNVVSVVQNIIRSKDCYWLLNIEN